MFERIYLENVRLSYPHLFVPRAAQEGGELRYSASLLLPKDRPVVNEMANAITKVISEEFGPQPGSLKPIPWYAGEEKYPEELACVGMIVIQSAAKNKPHVVDQNVKPVIDPGMVYAGCYVNASISIYAYKLQTGKGIAFGLDGVQFLRDGERLDGRPAADALFGKISGAPAPLTQGPGMPKIPGNPFS